MLQERPSDTAAKLLDTAASILTANGFELVTNDKRLFPSLRPDLAALKGGLLLVFAVKAFSAMGQFLTASEMNDIRQELDRVVAKNNPSKDPRVKRVQPAALVMTPEDVVVHSEESDIQWLVVRDYDQLPEQMDRVLP
ncbi:MAG: hypothetical protein ACUVX1_10360 [Chloroflexota bacterium]